MTRFSVRASTTALVCALVLGACGGSGSRSLSGTTRTPKLNVASITVPDVSQSEAGKPFTMRAAPNGLLLVFFGYTSCPDVCPTTMADIGIALKKVGKDASRVQVAFVTVDPERDTRTVMADFVGHFLDGGHLLRAASTEQLDRTKNAFLASATPAAKGTFDHSSAVSVVDETGTVLVEWPFGITPNAMADDLRILLHEADA